MPVETAPARPCQGRPSSPRGDNLGCAHGIFYDYFLGSGRKTTSTELALNLLSRTQRLLKNSSLLTFPVPKERRKLKDTHTNINIYIHI